MLGMVSVASILGAVIIFIGATNIVNAETRIAGGPLRTDTIWNASGSPYMIEDTVTVPIDHRLTIEEGTSVIGLPEVDGYSLIYVNGRLDILGSKDERVSISGFGSITNIGGTTTMNHSDISINEGISLYGGLTNISDSTISSSTYGIESSESSLNISRSRIVGNTYGVHVKKRDGVVNIMKVSSPVSFSGSESNTANSIVAVNISDSSLVDNTQASILNESLEEVNARNNWWGSDSGPTFVGANMIAGLVGYIPWLTKDPAIHSGAECCSSVLFIPGLEGSRLYRQVALPLGLGSSSNRLWEPLYNSNVKALYLDDSGKSIDPNIYSADPIDNALGIKGVYGKVMENLSSLVSSKVINEWRPYGYDWRRPISDVVVGPERRSTTTDSLVQTVIDMASRSMTGKVTLLAHSNGGLVSKYLVKILSDIGKADLVDKVISVAVPYLGTPQAILGLLHGSDQSIAYGLMTRESVARRLGANMASAYSLLPSVGYFAQKLGPVIAFASTTVPIVNNGKYPQTVSSLADQRSFVLGIGDKRVSPTSPDTSIPIKGNSTLMNIADNIHMIIDPFNWPVNLYNWAIVGWNQDTASGVKYMSKNNCLNIWCSSGVMHEKIISKLGDGTVISKSAEYGASSTVAIDLAKVSLIENTQVEHSNIMEASTTIRLINSIITMNGVASTPSNISGPLPAGVSIGSVSNIANIDESYVTVSTHSPVDLHIYDNKGKHTGSIDPPSGTEEVYEAYEENIPGSNYSKSDAGETYINLPNDGGEYRVEILGTGVGEFTLVVDHNNGVDSIAKIEYPFVPVTPLTNASMVVETGPDSISTNRKAKLNLDIEGDGKVDQIVEPGHMFDLDSYIEMYKKTMSSIPGLQARGKSLIKRFDNLKKLMKNGKLPSPHNISKRLDGTGRHVRIGKSDDSQKQMTMDMFDEFVQQFE